MIDLKILLLKALLIVAPPGNTKFSIVDTHKETYDEGAERYRDISDAEIEAAETELCTDTMGAPLGGCKANPKGKVWTVRDLVTRASGLAIAESGLREDVENGRTTQGGKGRGPAGEACLMQLLPAVIPAFAPDGDGSPSSVIGKENLVRCFRTGMRMMIQARAYCDWNHAVYISQMKILKIDMPPYDTYFGMFSMYGSGDSCYSNNAGKTSYRVAIANHVASTMKKIADSSMKYTIPP